MDSKSKIKELLISQMMAGTGGGGVTPAGTVEITENGTHDVASYASAAVAVPQPFIPDDYTLSERVLNMGVSDIAHARIGATFDLLTSLGEEIGDKLRFDGDVKDENQNNIFHYSIWGTVTGFTSEEKPIIRIDGVSIREYEDRTVTIAANGTVNVNGYNRATVQVPNELLPDDQFSGGYHDFTSNQALTTIQRIRVGTSLLLPVSLVGETVAVDDKVMVHGNVTNSGTAVGRYVMWGTVTEYNATNGAKVVIAGIAIHMNSNFAVTITANGTTAVQGIQTVNVNVPNTYAAADEGKVVSNGALVAQTAKTVTANGTVDTTENNSVVVNVPNDYLPDTATYTLFEGRGISTTLVMIANLCTVSTSVKTQVFVTSVDGFSVNQNALITGTLTDGVTKYAVWGKVAEVSSSTATNKYVMLYVAGATIKSQSNNSKTITANGTTGVWGYSRVSVNVPTPTDLGSVTYTEDDTYYPPSGGYYSEIIVQTGGGGGNIPNNVLMVNSPGEYMVNPQMLTSAGFSELIVMGASTVLWEWNYRRQYDEQTKQQWGNYATEYVSAMIGGQQSISLSDYQNYNVLLVNVS